MTHSRAAAIEELITERLTGQMMEREGTVSFKPPQRAEVPAGVPQPLGFGDGLRTHPSARAAVIFSDWSNLRMKELTRLEVLPDPAKTNTPGIKLYEGQIYVSSRGVGSRIVPIETPHARGVPRGTEFLVAVDLQAARTEVTMFDGEVELSNGIETRPVRSGEQGIVVPGQAIQVRPLIQSQNIVQWWIYYPGVLDVEELGLVPAEQAQLRASLQAYRDGDLQQALKDYPGYPSPPQPQSEAGRIYYAGLLLAVGAVDRALSQLEADKASATALALHVMVKAVTARTIPGTNQPKHSTIQPYGDSPSLLLALSYAHQATNDLKGALKAARLAVERAPNFGFGWARAAELEFAFGRTHRAREAVQRALELSHRNAQAHALRGFLFAAENRVSSALEAFNKAIEIDPALGNAWLGRGLCKRRGQIFGGRDPRALEWLSDIQIAAVLEPTRSLVRSYAGKAFAELGDSRLAGKELDYARKLDENDPTAWLYSALLKRDLNRINESVHDLEQSKARNDNRALYRSRLLLDQDQAVRGANLARIYKDAGLSDVSLREAVQAVNADYANYSAHLFLANSYAELSDPGLVNLRYETARVNEYLLATLLAPVGAGVLSQPVSQHEYSRLFERDHLGIFSSTEYRSSGDWMQSAAQYGTVKDFSYSLEGFYRSENGQRPDHDLLQKSLSFQTKYQLTAQDSFYLQGFYAKTEGGDRRQVFDPETEASRAFRFEEELEPILLAGYHREWQPGIHTLLLAGRLESDVKAENDSALLPSLTIENDGTISGAQRLLAADLRHVVDTTIYHAEVQQLMQLRSHTLIAGGRYQNGEFSTKSTLLNLRFVSDGFPLGGLASNPPQITRDDLERLSFYLYENWRVLEPVTLTAGVSYDQLRYPSNFRFAPISQGDSSTERVSPKFGVLWQLFQDTVLRGAYTEGLGGVSFDQSFRLEPTHVAGFNQTWRSLIPESITGASAAEEFQTWGAALDQKFPTGTYAGIMMEWLDSEVHRDVGIYRNVFAVPPFFQSTTLEELDYCERSFTLALRQLLGDCWAIGLNYRNSKAELNDRFPEIPSTAATPDPTFQRSTHLEGLLHHVNGFVLHNHPSGFFGQLEAHWYSQDNEKRLESTPVAQPDSHFWQFHAFVGYRFPRRKGEITLGLLNIADYDPRIHPINLLPELPRERTLVARVVFNF